MATNNQGPLAQQPERRAFTEGINSRLQSLIPSTADGTNPVCKECGSPISQASEFCWMCGASRDSVGDPRVDISPSGPVLLKPEPPTSGVKSDLRAGTGISPTEEVSPFTPIAPPVSGTSVLAWSPDQQASPMPASSPAPTNEPATATRDTAPESTIRPARNDGFFEPDFRPKFAESFPDEDQKSSRKPKIRIAVLAAVLALLAAVLYWQRDNAKIAFGALRASIQQQFSSILSEDSKQSFAPYTNPAAPKTGKGKHVRASEPNVQLPEVPRSQTAFAGVPQLPLGVRVQGQVKKASLVTASDGLVRSGAIQVGISSPLITTAKLSPMAVEISPRESLALLIRRVPLVYPEQARKFGVQGPVVMKVVIRKDGNVGDVRAISGDPLLTSAAVDSVRQWVYKPYYRDGVPIDVETIVDVEFSLASPVSPAN